MQDIAATVSLWVAQGRTTVIARAIELRGFGGRRDGEVVAWSGGDRVGNLFAGVGQPLLLAAAEQLAGSSAVTVEVELGDDDAVAAGLACGGSATVLVQDAAAIPRQVWDALGARDAVVLGSVLNGSGAMAITADGTTVGSLGAADAEIRAAAERLLRGGAGLRRRVEVDGSSVLVELLSPASKMLVVGASDLAVALVQQGKALGWQVGVVDERSVASEAIVTEAAALGPVDGLVVLSHAIGPSCAALAAALTSRCGYVGALGSRHTQAARAEQLRAVHGLSDATIARVHGPVGLDLGARTPEETALAVFAEQLANRSGRNAASLRVGSGPING
jgi:xanthine dehydrogenase accessory factor